MQPTKELLIIYLLCRLIQADETERKRSGQSGTLLINQSDHDNRTALHLAAAEGHYELVYYLLQQEGIQKYPKDRYSGLVHKIYIVSGSIFTKKKYGIEVFFKSII